MDTGLLWYDEDPIAQAVAKAAARYEKKMGQAPNVCYVNPAMLPDGEMQVGGCDGAPLRSAIVACHYWIGMEAGVGRSNEEADESKGRCAGSQTTAV